jgi:hypothetical protein
MKRLISILTIMCLLTIVHESIGQTSFNNTRSIELKKAISRSRSAKLTNPGMSSCIKVDPMQIAEGIVTVQLFNQPKGTYTVQLLDSNGKVLITKEIEHEDGTSAEVVQFAKYASGRYLPGRGYAAR